MLAVFSLDFLASFFLSPLLAKVVKNHLFFVYFYVCVCVTNPMS